MTEIWAQILRYKKVVSLSLLLLLAGAFYIFNTEKALPGTSRLDSEVDSWAIAINGEPLFYLDSQEKALQALELVKKPYLVEDDGQIKAAEVTFQEDVQILATKCKREQLITPERAVEIVNQQTDKTVPYTVQNGDSLWTIAKNNNLTVDELLAANPQIKAELIKKGDSLNLVKPKKLLNVVAAIKATVEEKIPYPTEYQNDTSLRKGQEQIKQEGTEGTRQVTYQITKVNGVETARESLAEQIVLKPVSRIVIRGSKTLVASRGGGGDGRLAWPLRGPITSPFGYRGKEFHEAIDIDGVTGDPVTAAESGVVISAGWDGNYGKSIAIDHGGGLVTRYSHLSTLLVAKNDKVERGQLIGRVGDTGRSTGSHLDFEVIVDGTHRNPLTYLK